MQGEPGQADDPRDQLALGSRGFPKTGISMSPRPITTRASRIPNNRESEFQPNDSGERGDGISNVSFSSSAPATISAGNLWTGGALRDRAPALHSPTNRPFAFTRTGKPGRVSDTMQSEIINDAGTPPVGARSNGILMVASSPTVHEPN